MAEKTSELDSILHLDADAQDDPNDILQVRSQNVVAVESKDNEEIEDEVTDETEQLREQIEETRRGMSETIDAIQEKLSFANISEQVQAQVSEQISGAVETAKDVFYGKAGEIADSVGKGFKQLSETDLAKRAQKNPTALALIGAGVGALLVSLLVGGKSKKKPVYSYDYNYRADEDFRNAKMYVARFDEEESFDDTDSDDTDFDEVRYVDTPRQELQPRTQAEPQQIASPSTATKVGDKASSAYKNVTGAAGTAYENVSSVAGSAYETLGSAANKTYGTVGSVAGKTYHGLSSAAGYTYEKAGDFGGQVKINYDHYIEENPLVVGAVAFAVGAAVGLAIPLTRKENEYLGEYRDAVIEKAQATAQEAIGTVKQVANEAQKVIAEEVNKEVKSKTA